jgi:hypothetical protein
LVLQVSVTPSRLLGGQPSFVQRLLRFTFRLASLQVSGQIVPTTSFVATSATSGPGTSPSIGANQATVSNLRASARITGAGSPVPGRLDLQIWGMPQMLMDNLSTLGQIVQIGTRNTILVEAGDATNGFASVFTGTLTQCWGAYENAPEVPFHVEAQVASADQVIPAVPTSIPGSADAATILSGLANQMNVRFENSGVSGVMLSNAYYYGSPYDQYRAIANDISDKVATTVNNGIMAIWPKTGSRGNAIPLVNPEHGLIGYPTYTAYGIEIRTIFNPNITLGGQIIVESTLKEATKTWRVFALNHSLDSLLPNGLWESRIACSPLATAPILPPF